MSFYEAPAGATTTFVNPDGTDLRTGIFNPSSVWFGLDQGQPHGAEIFNTRFAARYGTPAAFPPPPKGSVRPVVAKELSGTVSELMLFAKTSGIAPPIGAWGTGPTPTAAPVSPFSTQPPSAPAELTEMDIFDFEYVALPEGEKTPWYITIKEAWEKAGGGVPLPPPHPGGTRLTHPWREHPNTINNNADPASWPAVYLADADLLDAYEAKHGPLGLLPADAGYEFWTLDFETGRKAVRALLGAPAEAPAPPDSGDANATLAAVMPDILAQVSASDAKLFGNVEAELDVLMRQAEANTVLAGIEVRGLHRVLGSYLASLEARLTAQRRADLGAS